MAVVEGRLTPIDPLVALGALCLAFELVLGRPPTVSEAKILWAMASHESGKFQKMKNNGVAGVKATPGYKGDVAIYKTTERENGVNVVKDQPFRAYASPLDGFKDWLDLLRRLYPKALEAAARGDVEAFVEGLQNGVGGRKYFTADPAAYTAGVWRNLRELDTSYVISWADFTARKGREST